MIREQTETLSRWVLPDEATDAEREQHAIPAAEVIEALRAGRAVEIANAIVVGPLLLRSHVIAGEMQIRCTVFRGPADWSHAAFKGVVSVEHSTFEDRLSLRAARLEQDVTLDHSTFVVQLVATQLAVAGTFSARSATFRESPLFDHATFTQNANFGSAVFAAGAHFGWGRFDAEANFSKARFQRLASFNGTSIRGTAFFDEVTFDEKADFPDARFGGTAYFNQARFMGEANFAESRAEGNVVLSGAVFEGEAGFLRFRAGGAVNADGTAFTGAAIFNSLQIEGSVFFERARFEGSLNLAASRIRGAVNFQYAVLHDADFSSTEVLGGAYFGNATVEGVIRFLNLSTTRAVFNEAAFKQEVSFYRVRCTDDALFIGTVFSKDVSFEGASFQSMQLGQPRMQFQQTVDLRGCTYSRLEPLEYWADLMARLKPYDRQPFTQLEETLRRAGHDRTARDVYYWRKRRESKRLTVRTPLSWMLDRMLWLLTGYGVRLERLFVATAIILLAATLVFQRQGAVTTQTPSAVSGSPAITQPLTLLPRDAFWFSVKLFVPVDIPASGDWRPSSSVEVWGFRMTTVATLLRLAGWILVPIGLAGVTGFLKR